MCAKMAEATAITTAANSVVEVDAVTADGALTNGGQNRLGPPLVIPLPPSEMAILLRVLHNFEARSPDELTLRKGEHVELLEKDGRN